MCRARARIKVRVQTHVMCRSRACIEVHVQTHVMVCAV